MPPSAMTRLPPARIITASVLDSPLKPTVTAVVTVMVWSAWISATSSSPGTCPPVQELPTLQSPVAADVIGTGGDAHGLAEGLTEALGDAEADGLGDALGDADTDAEGDAEALGEALALGLALGLAEGLAISLLPIELP